MSEPVIRARGLVRRHRGARPGIFQPRAETTALAGVDLDLTAGAALGIVGESGSGKSTLVRILLGLERATAGSVEIAGRAVAASEPARSLRWLRAQTGIVFQDPYASLDPRMSVGRIIGEPLWALHLPGDRRARVREVLAQVGLDAADADRYPHEFSGGQRQRIALARAIVHRPRILVGDEPLSALDVTVRAQILELLAQLRAQEELTLVLVSHDLGVVQHICTDVAVMSAGRIVERGPASAVLGDPRDAYTRRLLSAVPTLPPLTPERTDPSS